MAINDEEDDGIDNGDGIDQCIVWWCDDVRGVEWGETRFVFALYCFDHREFAHVDQEAYNGI